MRVAILGLGLIGGSLAHALHARAGTRWSVVAWTPSGDGPRAALAAGVIDEAAPDVASAVRGADLVVLAAPPLACLDLVAALGGPLAGDLSSETVVTDVASTKVAIVEEAHSGGLRFVGGHPMAGRETAGFEAADGSLFEGRPWVVVPSGDEAAIGRVEALATACGARPLRMDAARHDAAVAAISHLPLVLAAALVEAIAGPPGAARPGWVDAAPLAATGWSSMTRLARGDVTMGAQIAATNAPEIAARLRDLRAELDGWLALLEAPGGPDAEGIRARLAAARARLEG